MAARVTLESLDCRRMLAYIASDVTWGEDGYVRRADLGEFAARSGDGFLTARHVYGTSDWTTTVSRFTDAGEADAAFTPIRQIGELPQIAADADGRPVVADVDSAGRVVVRRYTAGGEADETFGGTGAAAFFPARRGYRDTTLAFVLNLAAGPDGTVFVLTRVDYNGLIKSDFAVTKFRADGSADASFGSNGTAKLEGFSSYADRRADLKVDSAGRVLAGAYYSGYFDNQYRSGYAVFRLDSAGRPDTGFADQGRLYFGSYVLLGSLAVDRADRVLVVRGFGTVGYPVARGQVLRFTSRGRTDMTFGRRGVSQPVDDPASGTQQARIIPLDDGTLVTQLGAYVVRLGENGLATRRGIFETTDDVELVDAKSDGTLLAEGVEKFGTSVTRLAAIPPAAVGRSGVLYLNGTSNPDAFSVKPVDGTAGRLAVYVLGQRYGVFNGVKTITARLGEGADTLLAGGVSVPMTIDAGPGNDTIATGSGTDVIDLGAGSNAVEAGSGGGRVIAQTTDAAVRNVIHGVGGRRDDWLVIVRGGRLRVALTGRHIKVNADTTVGTTMVLNATTAASVIGSAGPDSIFTGRGNDTITAGTGQDTLNAGAGTDTAIGAYDEDDLLAGIEVVRPA